MSVRLRLFPTRGSIDSCDNTPLNRRPIDSSIEANNTSGTACVIVGRPLQLELTAPGDMVYLKHSPAMRCYVVLRGVVLLTNNVLDREGVEVSKMLSTARNCPDRNSKFCRVRFGARAHKSYCGLHPPCFAPAAAKHGRKHGSVVSNLSAATARKTHSSRVLGLNTASRFRQVGCADTGTGRRIRSPV